MTLSDVIQLLTLLVMFASLMIDIIHLIIELIKLSNKKMTATSSKLCGHL